jgi:hypothetical protein
MKAKSLMKWMFPLLMQVPVLGIAQTTVIDYTFWSGTSNCNAFGAPTVVSAVQHKSTLGQPKYGSYNDPVILECIPQDFNNFDAKGTEYAISHSFLANHQYKVTVKCASVATGLLPKLVLTYTNTTATSTACTGPAIDTDPGASGYGIGTGSYLDYVYTNTIGAQAQSYLKFRSIAAYGGSTLQKVIIRMITIEDITPAAPTFSITSSVASRTCGTALLSPITFTVNSQNATNITGYDYIVTPYQWMIGFPATWVTGTIHQASNIISLDPIQCGTGSSITVIPYINNVAQAPVTKTITINTPSFSISGPSSLNMVSALYDLQGSNVCGAIPTWSVSNNFAQLYVNSATNVGLSPNINALGNIILQAVIPQCGINVTATKTIYVTGPPRRINAPFSGLEETSNEPVNVTPNPSNGIFNLHFGKSLDKAKLSIISIDGKEIFNEEVSGSNQSVDLSTSPAGIYLLKVNTGTTIETKKLVKTN